MAKDALMEAIQTSVTYKNANHCDKIMEEEKRQLKNILDVKQTSQVHDKCDHTKDDDDNDMPNIKISSIMGCNYQKDLKNDLVTNTDKIGAARSEFYFETDHEALRGNPDYLAVLRTLAILEAQKIQAVKDLETLQDARTSAIKDPLTLISKLQNGDDLKLPGKQKIAHVPYINWDKYGLASLSQLATFSLRKPETRRNVSTLINHVGMYLLMLCLLVYEASRP